LRLDKFLWFARLARSRTVAQHLIEEGHVRVNGARIGRSAKAVSDRDVIVLPYRMGVLVIQITTLPDRRGPSSEAQSCYRVLDGQGDNPIAGLDQTAAEGTSLP
jgi:ribosome-associated heat shock protein Hsp15